MVLILDQATMQMLFRSSNDVIMAKVLTGERMRISSFFLKVSILIFVCFSQRDVHALNLVCPHKIQVSQKVMEAPGDWTAEDSLLEHRLLAAGFSDGPPAKMAILKPDNVRERGKTSIVTWQLYPNVAEGFWLSCSYADTTAKVSQMLPNNISECSVVYEKQPNERAVVRLIKCK